MDKHNELTFHLMVEASPNALVLVNQGGKIAYINESAEKMFLYRKSEIIGRKLEVLVPEKFKSLHPDHVKSYYMLYFLKIKIYY